MVDSITFPSYLLNDPLDIGERCKGYIRAFALDTP